MLKVIKLFQSLPKTDEARIIGKQLLRAATSVAANYRASCRTRLDAGFFRKISIVVEETGETLCWPELPLESEIVSKEKLSLSMTDYEEVLKIANTARYHR